MRSRLGWTRFASRNAPESDGASRIIRPRSRFEQFRDTRASPTIRAANQDDGSDSSDCCEESYGLDAGRRSETAGQRGRAPRHERALAVIALDRAGDAVEIRKEASF